MSNFVKVESDRTCLGIMSKGWGLRDQDSIRRGCSGFARRGTSGSCQV